jgi:transcriptional regulator with XRE-family HTH domain
VKLYLFALQLLLWEVPQMSITAKELAEKLNLSQTAVSMALNNKPGVSTETRRMVIEAATTLPNFL